MSYAEKTAYYRNLLLVCVGKDDRENARLNAIMYVKVLREMAALCKSYVQRAYLHSEADRYEYIAALITKEGVTDRVKNALNMGVSENRPSMPPVASTTIEPKTPATLKVSAIPNAPAAPKTFVEPVATPAPVFMGDEWIADVFEKHLPATLIVDTETGTGTGFFISEGGLILTNHHVVHDRGVLEKQIQVTSGDKKIDCKATFIAADKKRDVALLKAEIANQKVPSIPFIKDYTQLRPGMEVMVIGNAFSFGLAPISGNVKFTHAEDDNDLIYTAPSNNGDSGGPVLNRKGECVGIHKSSTVSVGAGSRRVDAKGLTNATPADEIVAFVKKWKKEYKLR